MGSIGQYEIVKGVAQETVVETGGYKGYSSLKDIVKEYKVTVVVNQEDAGKVFPWVQTAISNANACIRYMA